MPIDYRDIQQILAQLADQITTAMIQDASISTVKIQDDAITTVKILNAAVDGAKLAATLSGAHTFSGVITHTDDINMGGNSLLTTDLLLRQVTNTSWILRDAADTVNRNLILNTITFERAAGGDAESFLNATDIDDSALVIQAHDNGVGLLEVARLFSGDDPSFDLLVGRLTGALNANTFGITNLDEILSDAAQVFTITGRAVNNILHLICLRNAANAGNGILLTTLNASDAQINRVIIPSGTDEVSMTFTDCNLIPAANKDNSLGITGTRWLDIFSGNAVTSGTSRIVRSTAVCPRCKVNAVRSTGGVLALGDSYDYMMAHCPECGMVVAEKFSHSSDILIPPPKSIRLKGIVVGAQSGNTRSVRMEFMYNGKDRNVGYLDEYEIEEFVNGDERVRMNLIMKVGMQEWEADTRTKIMEWYVKQENERFRVYAAPFMRKNLLAS